LESRKSIQKAKAELQFHRMALQSLELASSYMQKVPVEINTNADFKLLQMTCGEITETKFFLTKCVSSPHIEHLKSVRLLCCRKIFPAPVVNT